MTLAKELTAGGESQLRSKYPISREVWFAVRKKWEQERTERLSYRHL